ncbi:MAG: hypothetical protein LAO55_08765 [Acidobacteriia bacterium]|nr:hypothetical protein [Terriglobia bacterium]
MHWWKYYGVSLAVVCAIGPKIVWAWLLRKGKWRLAKPEAGFLGRTTLLFVLYAASFAIFIALFYIGLYAAALTDGL